MSTHGIQAVQSYAGAATIGAVFDLLLALVPDPDNQGPVPNPSTVNAYLDEMSPGAATQLRVELTAAKTKAITIAP